MAPDAGPAVDAGLLGEVLGRLPGRLRRRLEAEPAMAEALPWTVDEDGATTVAFEDATVRLEPDGDGVVRRPEGASCSCLLAPSCLHLAAVLTRLAPSTGAPAETDETQAASDAPRATGTAAVVGTAPAEPETPTPAMVDAANQLLAAMARLLDAGANAAGLIATGDILRAVHSAQVAGLHRATAAGLRVAQGLARLRDDDPEFRLRDLRNDVAEVVGVARAVAGRRVDRGSIGVARRAYTAVGGLRLYGLFTEPVVSRSGYAGCATWLVDPSGQLWVLSDVLPAPAERAVDAYVQAVGLGDVALTHRRLGREGVLLADARASEQGRLGRGQQVRAVSAEGAGWAEPPIANLFEPPLAAQLARVWAAADEPPDQRREGWDLIFVPAVVVGARKDRLVLDVDGVWLVGVAAGEQAELDYQENLRVLAGAPGLRLLMVGRPQLSAPGVLELVAVGEAQAPAAVAEGMPGTVALPAGWDGRASLGLDRLHASQLRPGPRPSEPQPPGRIPDATESLARRLDRMVLGGRPTLGVVARRGVDQDVALLRRRHLATGAELLAALATAAAARSPAHDVAEAWHAATVYERAVGRRLGSARWLAGAPADRRT